MEKELEDKAKEMEGIKYQLLEANRYIKKLQVRFFLNHDAFLLNEPISDAIRHVQKRKYKFESSKRGT